MTPARRADRDRRPTEEQGSIIEQLRTTLADNLATDDRNGVVIAEEAPGVALVRYRGPDRALVAQQRLRECTGRLRRAGFSIEALGFARWIAGCPPGVAVGTQPPARARRIPPNDPRLQVMASAPRPSPPAPSSAEPSRGLAPPSRAAIVSGSSRTLASWGGLVISSARRASARGGGAPDLARGAPIDVGCQDGQH